MTFNLSSYLARMNQMLLIGFSFCTHTARHIVMTGRCPSHSGGILTLTQDGSYRWGPDWPVYWYTARHITLPDMSAVHCRLTEGTGLTARGAQVARLGFLWARNASPEEGAVGVWDGWAPRELPFIWSFLRRSFLKRYILLIYSKKNSLNWPSGGRV